jgi:NAD(P)-dependent dehydrogenase (short-subunit alcohol dehydrogenase family)
MPDGQIIVTGASRGIGAAIMDDLARRGFAVVGLSRSGKSAVGRGMACDMTDEAAVSEAFAAIAGEGTIAGLVNNAGLHATSPSAELASDDFDRIMALNARSVMVASREAYPYLKARGGGTIVNLGSFFDKLGVVGNLAYCASKAAVGAITRCLAVEWAGDGIRVLNVAPGYIETDLNRALLARDSVGAVLRQRIPTGGPGAADEVAGLIGAILAENLSFLTGETIYIDGGHGMNH